MYKFKNVLWIFQSCLQDFIEMKNRIGKTNDRLNKKNNFKAVVDLLNEITDQIITAAPFFQFHRRAAKISLVNVFFLNGVGQYFQFLKQKRDR